MPLTPRASDGMTSRSPPTIISVRYWVLRFGLAGSVKPPRIADGVPQAASAFGAGVAVAGPGVRSGVELRRPVVDEARLPFIGEGADDEVHGDLFVVAAVRRVELL